MKEETGSKRNVKSIEYPSTQKTTGRCRKVKEDEVRAKAMAVLRKKEYPEPSTKRRLQYGQWAEEEMAEWNKLHSVQRREEEKYIERNKQCGGWKETEAEREERRIRNSRGKLIERETLRLAGIKRSGERRSDETTRKRKT